MGGWKSPALQFLVAKPDIGSISPWIRGLQWCWKHQKGCCPQHSPPTCWCQETYCGTHSGLSVLTVCSYSPHFSAWDQSYHEDKYHTALSPLSDVRLSWFDERVAKNKKKSICIWPEIQGFHSLFLCLNRSFERYRTYIQHSYSGTSNGHRKHDAVI